MKNLLIPALIALSTPGTLLAQTPHFGGSLDLIAPVGRFSSQTLPAYSYNGGVVPEQTAGYDLGFGGRLHISFPVDPKLAIRLHLGGHSVEGTDTAPGEDKIYLRHAMFSVGGDLQLFTGSAYRHRGTYFLLGLSADFERFDRSYEPFDYDHYHERYGYDYDSTRKTRTGANFGIGHTFGWDAGPRFVLEASLHKTLSGRDTAVSDPVPADFLRFSFGFVF